MDSDHARQLLGAERERLATLLDEEMRVVAAARSGPSEELASYDQHPGDAASDTFEQAKEQSIADSLRAQLAAVDAALRRLEEGSYGHCTVCGSDIPDERLQARPATPYCVTHQSEFGRFARPGR